MNENGALFAAAITFPLSASSVWITAMVLRYRAQQRNAARNAAKAAQKASTP